VKKPTWYILARKVLPGVTTLVACCRRPTSNNISLFVAFFEIARHQLAGRYDAAYQANVPACP